MAPELILVNPWITDFAAYDLWSKPLGLLTLAGDLRSRGYGIHLIDCLDVHHPEMAANAEAVRPVRRVFGTGKFWRTEIDPPECLSSISRPYSRYGITPALFARALEAVENPAAVLVTSMMTYWYPGVQEAISIVRNVHPRTPVILGGVYATLCLTHAVRCAGADLVIGTTGGGSAESVCRMLEELGVKRPTPLPPGAVPPYPAFDLLRRPDAVCIATSTGCPYRCTYCASGYLRPEFKQRPCRDVLEEILHWRETLGVRDVAFYDDALLVGSDTHFRPLMNALIRHTAELRFHVPNALHLREITAPTALLLYEAGFRTVRLGLETTDSRIRSRLDQKAMPKEFERAVQALRRAGYGRREIGVYVMMGMPGQSVDSVKQTLIDVDRAGAVPHLAEYSPIPHTPLWPEAQAASSWDLSEPLFQNNTLLPCWDERARGASTKLRAMVREMRRTRSGETSKE